jgi:hypothetical protein
MAFFWGNPWHWIRARRHVASRWLAWDTVDRKRKLWSDCQARRHGRDFRLELPDLPQRFSFLVFGDAGEGDASQWVLVDKLLREAEDAAFTVIASDVTYPAGRSHEYRQNFYVPYRQLPGDVFAVPGNHDWYDELIGFMIHFCDTQQHYRKPGRTVDPAKLQELRRIRCNRVFQPNMYFYIDTPELRIVGIDTGIRGRVDDEQLAWLQRVSEPDKPKLLILGKPIYCDGRYRTGLARVDEVVKRGGYVLVIAGDTHNFQRYRIPVGERVVWHVVAGGGGAYTNRTHRIPLARNMRLPVPLAREPDDFDCYPTRDQSRALVTGWRRHVPDWFFDADRPPYHKSFLKLSVGDGRLEVRVFTVDDFGPRDLQAGPRLSWSIPLR